MKHIPPQFWGLVGLGIFLFLLILPFLIGDILTNQCL